MNVFVCRVCGLVSKSWAAAERHARSERHHRVEIEIRSAEGATK